MLKRHGGKIVVLIIFPCLLFLAHIYHPHNLQSTPIFTTHILCTAILILILPGEALALHGCSDCRQQKVQWLSEVIITACV